MTSTESIEKDGFVGISDLFPCHDTSHWETIAHTFGQSDDVRLETRPSVSPELFSDSSETGLDLISDHNTPVFFNELCDSWSVSLRDGVDSSDTLDGFEDHTCDFSMSSVRLEGFLCVFDEQLGGLDCASVLTGPSEFFELMTVIEVRVPCPNVGDTFGVTHKPVVPVSQREELMLPGEESRQKDSHIVGLTATVTEENLIVFRTELVAKSLRIFTLPFGQVDGGGMHQFVCLFGDELGDAWMSVTNRDGRDTGDQVEISVALVVEQVLVLALNDKERLLVEVEVNPRGHVLVSQSLHFFVGGTGVGPWFEAEFRKSQFTNVLHYLNLFIKDILTPI